MLRQMLRTLFTICSIASITFSLFILGCVEIDDSENEIQKELSSLLLLLESATSSNNEEDLSKIISTSRNLRPTVQTQKESVQLLVSTAKGKLAQLKIAAIQAQTNTIVSQFQLAMHQSNQVASLRHSADAHALASEEAGIDLTPEIESAYAELQWVFADQIQEAMNAIAQIEAKSEDARQDANALVEEAELMFNEAEVAGIIDGHRSFKSAVKTMRESHQVEMQANDLTLQSDVLLRPSLEDIRAETQAAASILLSVKQTRGLLSQLRNSAMDSALALRQAADEIDNNAASTMNNAINRSNKLRSAWDESISLLQDAIQKSPHLRNSPREMQRSSNLWKLDMEWLLALAQESRKNFLVEQSHALAAMTTNGIVTNASKWVELGRSTNEAIEQSLNAAIAAYENAKQLASSASQQSDMLTYQLESRIAMLQGQPLPEMNSTTAIPTTSTTPSTPSGSTYATVERLINAFNTMPLLGTRTMMDNPIDLNTFFVARDEGGQKILDFQRDLYLTTSEMLSAVSTHLGENELNKMIRERGSGGFELAPKIDLTSVVMLGDDEATATDSRGTMRTLTKTSQGWKIVMNSTGQDAEVALMMVDMMGPAVDGMRAVIPQIKDGSIKTFEELEIALEANSPIF